MRRPLLLLLAQLGVALSIDFNNQLLLLPLALIPVLLLRWRLFGLLLRRNLLVFLALMIGGVPILLGGRSATVLGVPYSPDYLRASVVMAARCAVILLSLKLFTSLVSLNELADRMARTRFRQFGEAFQVSMQLLPRFRASALSSYREYRASLTRRNALPHTFSWTVELIARALVEAEREWSHLDWRAHDR